MYRVITHGVEVPAWKCLTSLKVNTARFHVNTAFGSVHNSQVRENMATVSPEGHAGWDIQFPATLLSPTCFPFRDTYTNEAVDEHAEFADALQKRADEYKKLQVDKSSEDELNGFRHLYCDEEGRLKLPKFGDYHWVLAGNQRVVNVIAAAAGLALKRGHKFKKTIPAIIIESDSMAQIQEEQLKGNQHQLAVNRMGILDALQPCITFIRQGMSEQRFCELVGAKRVGSEDKDDVNNPDVKNIDKSYGRKVYKLGRVANACINAGVEFISLLVEGVNAKSLEKGKIPIERFRMTKGGPFDLAQTDRCLVDISDPVNGMSLYVRKYKQDKPELLTDEERDVYLNGKWNKQKLQEWVDSVKVGGNAVPVATTTTVKAGMTAEVAKSKAQPLGSNLLANYIGDLIAEKTSTDALNNMDQIGSMIDLLPAFAKVRGCKQFITELSHYIDSLTAEHISDATALVAKMNETLEHGIKKFVKASQRKNEHVAVEHVAVEHVAVEVASEMLEAEPETVEPETVEPAAEPETVEATTAKSGRGRKSSK